MITVNIREEDEFIKLGQALKKAGVVGSGVDAKMVILDGQVAEAMALVRALNKMTKAGMPEGVRIA